jgi:hypothetical protein
MFHEFLSRGDRVRYAAAEPGGRDSAKGTDEQHHLA